MDSTVLVDRDIEAGERLVSILDQKGMPLVAAFWYQSPETEKWWLYLASPWVAEKGPREVFAFIIGAIRGANPPIPLAAEDTQVVTENDPLALELMIFRGTDKSPCIGGSKISQERVGDTFFQGAYVYRAERILGIDHEFRLNFAVKDRRDSTWKLAPGSVTVKGGFVVSIDVPNDTISLHRGSRGISADFKTVDSTVVKNGNSYAMLKRWEIRNGRIMHMAPERHPVQIHGVIPLQAA